MPPENERTPLPQRQGELKKAVPAATLLVFPPRVRKPGVGSDVASAAELAKRLSQAGLCRATAGEHSPWRGSPPAGPNELKMLWDLAREFRDYVRANPVDADYVLCGDYAFNPQRWEQGFVHFVVCDRKGDWVIVDLQNSHHADYQSIKPTSKEACDELLVKRLKSYLR